MKVAVVGSGRLGAGICAFTRRRAIDLLEVYDVSQSTLVRLQDFTPTLLFVTVNTKSMRGTLKEVVNSILDKVLPLKSIAFAFDPSAHLEHIPANSVRFSASPAIGTIPDRSHLLYSKQAPTTARETLLEWATGVNTLPVDDHEFDVSEAAFAFSGVGTALISQFAAHNSIQSDHPYFRVAIEEMANLLRWADSDPIKAYQVTATPSGIVHTSSCSLIRGWSDDR